MNAPTYEIRDVWDFLKVPEDRIAECLREFAIALEMSRATTALVEAVGDEMYGKGAIRCPPSGPFRWVDDSLGIAEVRIKVPSAAVPTPEER